MTPITHGMIGWIISQPLEKRKDRWLVMAASLVPDLDGLGAIISIDYYAKYHHIFGHNFFFGILLSLLALKFAEDKKKAPLLVFLSFNSHILGDLLGSGVGWGVPYFWPLSKINYEFSPPFQWELDSWQNLLATAICMAIIFLCGLNKKRTIVEMFSVKTDLKVVAVFQGWLVGLKKIFR
jgi:membrane-bound metal-dependent hydrolase YbcI (DUF457 family)